MGSVPSKTLALHSDYDSMRGGCSDSSVESGREGKMKTIILKLTDFRITRDDDTGISRVEYHDGEKGGFQITGVQGIVILALADEILRLNKEEAP